MNDATFRRRAHALLMGSAQRFPMCNASCCPDGAEYRCLLAAGPTAPLPELKAPPFPGSRPSCGIDPPTCGPEYHSPTCRPFSSTSNFVWGPSPLRAPAVWVMGSKAGEQPRGVYDRETRALVMLCASQDEAERAVLEHNRGAASHESHLVGPEHCSCCGANKAPHDGPCCRMGF